MDDKNHGVVWSKPLPMDRPLWGFGDLPIEYKIQACFTQGEQDDAKSIITQNNGNYIIYNVMTYISQVLLLYIVN